MSEVWKYLLQQHFPLSVRKHSLNSGLRSVCRSLHGRSGASPSSWKLFASPLTVVKSLRCRVMQLAGYICPTTEEVACESRDPAPQKKERSSLLPSLFPVTSNGTGEKFRRCRVMGAPCTARWLCAPVSPLLID